jgi:hypothetical protein
MLAGMGTFVTNDALVKFASQSRPASQLIFVRGIFATAILVSIGLIMRLPLWANAITNRRVLLRAGLESLATVAYVTAIVHLQLQTPLPSIWHRR